MTAGLFDGLTVRLREALVLAQKEARRVNHHYVGTEHLLLGLVGIPDGVGAAILLNLGVELEKVRSAVRYVIGRVAHPVTPELGLTPRAALVLRLALDEAYRLHHLYVGTEHLLLGLLVEGEGIAAGVLQALGVNLLSARFELECIMADDGPGPRRRRPGSPDIGLLWDTSRAYSVLAALRNVLARGDALPDDLAPILRGPRRMSVVPVFAGREFVIDDKLCFVLMPFAEELRPIYEDHIRKAVRACGLQCVRADDVFGPGQIMEQIWELMNRARLLIADVTDKNPNVFYELGVAHTLGKAVVLITRVKEDIPFDLQHLRYILYDYTPRGCRELERKLREAIAAVSSAPRG